MQTFLPYQDFCKSAECLDYRRLGKQRIEGKQVLKIIWHIQKRNLYRNKNGKRVKRGWLNHPTVKMWIGFENALKLYVNTCIIIWKERGFNNNMRLLRIKEKIIYPQWLGNQEFHASHRSNLLRKNKSFYSQYNWNEPDNLPYIWPAKEVNHD